MASVNDERLSDEMQKLTLCNFDGGSVHKVYVTHINNPHDFYVMPGPYKYYLRKLELPGISLNRDNIQRGAKVIFLSKNKQRFLRGKIYNVDEANSICHLVAYDYGFMEASVAFSDIFHLGEYLQQIPPLIYNCQLIECYPIGGSHWDPETVDFMKNYVGENLSEIVVKGRLGDKYLVELNNFTNPGLSMEMVLLGLSHFCCGPNNINKFSHPMPEKHFFTFKDVNVGDHLHVRAVTGKTLDSFYVTEIDDYRKHIEELTDFKYVAMQSKSFPLDKIYVGAPVLLFDSYYGSYERAIIKKILDSKCLVQYVDNGTEKLQRPEIFKKMGEYFFRNPALAIYCAAENGQRVDFRLQKFLYPGFEFTIKILELGNKLDKPHIVQLLK